MSDTIPEREVTFATYERMLSDHPFKFSAEEVEYRKADGREQCEYCVHFYERKVDGWTVCEILRDIPNDDEEAERPIKPDWRCRFMTPDGVKFPLLEAELDSADE